MTNPNPRPSSPRLLALSIIGVLVLACLFFPPTIFWRSNKANDETNRAFECSDHLQKVAMAFQNFALDHDGKLPDAKSWCGDLLPYLKGEVLHCPSDPSSSRSSYAMNVNLSRKNLEEVVKGDGDTVLLVETAVRGENPSGTGPKDVASARHRRSINPNPGVAGIRVTSESNFAKGSHVLLAGHWQPVFVLQSKADEKDLMKGVVSGRDADKFKW